MTDPQHEETFADTERKLRETITTLRAQLAETRAGNRALLDARDDMERCWREQKTRADRIEALIGEREVWKDRAMQVQDERDELNNQLIATLAELKGASHD